MIERTHASGRQHGALRKAARLNLLVAGSLLLAASTGCSAKPTGNSGTLPLGNAGGPAGAAASSASTRRISVTTPPAQTASASPSSAGSVASGQTQPISIDPISIDDCGTNNQAGLAPSDAQRLRAGGGGPGNLQILYPAEGTVFPRGMLSPDLMWGGQAAGVAYRWTASFRCSASLNTVRVCFPRIDPLPSAATENLTASC